MLLGPEQIFFHPLQKMDGFQLLFQWEKDRRSDGGNDAEDEQDDERFKQGETRSAKTARG
jgi:hypothetical protein